MGVHVLVRACMCCSLGVHVLLLCRYGVWGVLLGVHVLVRARVCVSCACQGMWQACLGLLFEFLHEFSSPSGLISAA